MKAPLGFVLGMVSGAIVASVLWLVVDSRDRHSNQAEVASLKAELSRALKDAQHDREALRRAPSEPAQQERQVPQAAVASTTPSLPDAATEVANVPPANAAIENYLGAPVPAPANLDPRYSAEQISTVFRNLLETHGVKVDKLGVDTSEFPFVLHGRVESTAGAEFFKKMNDELRALPGYTYGGSVTGGTKDGVTYFALNMTPSSSYPREHTEAIRRRLVLRLQMIAAAWGE